MDDARFSPQSAVLTAGCQTRFENAGGSDGRRWEGLDFCASINEPMVVYYEQVLLIVENSRLLNSVEWQVSIYDRCSNIIAA
jgi:hypothetical protein